MAGKGDEGGREVSVGRRYIFLRREPSAASFSRWLLSGERIDAGASPALAAAASSRFLLRRLPLRSPPLIFAGRIATPTPPSSSSQRMALAASRRARTKLHLLAASRDAAIDLRVSAGCRLPPAMHRLRRSAPSWLAATAAALGGGSGAAAARHRLPPPISLTPLRFSCRHRLAACFTPPPTLRALIAASLSPDTALASAATRALPPGTLDCCRLSLRQAGERRVDEEEYMWTTWPHLF